MKPIEPRPSLPSYAQAILEMFARSEFKPGVSHIIVSHDDGCSIWTGGRCNCSPEFELRPEVG